MFLAADDPRSSDLRRQVNLPRVVQGFAELERRISEVEVGASILQFISFTAQAGLVRGARLLVGGLPLYRVKTCGSGSSAAWDRKVARSSKRSTQTHQMITPQSPACSQSIRTAFDLLAVVVWCIFFASLVSRNRLVLYAHGQVTPY